jgi:heme/copper-type cytochrome/quinol oxidase subunit 1
MPMIWLGYCGMPRRVFDYPASLGGWHAMSSAGHLFTVTALLAFIMMLYDSIRQNKPAIRNNFGVGRFNTRINFYFFEINRLSFTQRKSFFLARYDLSSLNTRSNTKKIDYLTLASLDSTLLSYKFF